MSLNTNAVATNPCVSLMREHLWSEPTQQGSSLFYCYGKTAIRNGYGGTLFNRQYSHKCGWAHSLTLAKLTPRSNAAKYRTSGTDTDNTCGGVEISPSTKHNLQYTGIPGASALIPETDSSWSAVKDASGIELCGGSSDSKSNLSS